MVGLLRLFGPRCDLINGIEWLAFGDSIALGVAQAAGLPCNAVVGRMPDAVQAAIERTEPEFIRGRSVILSTGLSNNPDGKAHVMPQFLALIRAGARMIVVVGMGAGSPEVDWLYGLNDWLTAEIDKAKQPSIIRFAGPLQSVRPDGVHPYYDQLVDQINAIL